jgi:GNAT superfamily N-acetyltransferase
MTAFSFTTFAAPDETLLEKFYDLYGRVFTLPEEREPVDGFATVLALNGDVTVQRDFGPLEERITLATDADGRVLGATNYILYAYPDSAFDYAASCQLNFICVDDMARGRGIAGQLLKKLEEDVKHYAGMKAPLRPQAAFITCEQNDPALMTPQQLADDKAASGIDAQARLAWWVHRDYHRLDFRYRQPPLNPGQEACEYLNYYVHFVPNGAAPHRLPAALLKDHLRRFFFVSVGKLEVDMESNPQWRQQRDLLDRQEWVAVK